MMVGKRKEEYAPFYYTLLEKAGHPGRMINSNSELKKSQSLSQDSNPACPDIMPSLYHLCQHHFLIMFSLRRLAKPSRSLAEPGKLRPWYFWAHRLFTAEKNLAIATRLDPHPD